MARVRVRKEKKWNRKWRHRGHEKLVLSKIWPDGTRFRRFMPNKTVAKQLETKIDYATATDTWRELKDALAKGTARSVQNPTIGDFAEEYLHYCRPRNRSIDFKQRNVGHLVRIIGEVGIRDFKRRHADRFVDERRSDGV